MSDPVRTSVRGRDILLIVSLCLNVALLAMIAVGIIAALRAPLRQPGSGPLAPQNVLAEVQPSEKPKIQAVIDAHAAKLRELRMEAAQARAAAFRIFAEPTFSPNDFAASLQRARDADVAVEDETVKQLSEMVAQLSPAERAAIADKVRARARPMWRLFMPKRIGQ
jgi:uncharacterized membrane protein